MNPALKNILNYCERNDQLCTKIWTGILTAVIFVSLTVFIHIVVDQYEIKNAQAVVNAEKIKLLEEQVQLLKQIVKQEHGHNL